MTPLTKDLELESLNSHVSNILNQFPKPKNLPEAHILETPLTHHQLNGASFYVKCDGLAKISLGDTQEHTAVQDQLSGNKARKNTPVLSQLLEFLSDPSIKTIYVTPQGAVTSNYIMLLANDIAKLLEQKKNEITSDKHIIFTPFHHDRNEDDFPYDRSKGNVATTIQIIDNLTQFLPDNIKINYSCPDTHLFKDEAELTATKTNFLEEKQNEAGAAILNSVGGGSVAENCVGYAECTVEILKQLLGNTDNTNITEDDLNKKGITIVTPTGSLGTQSGLLAGAQIIKEQYGIDFRVIGVSNRSKSGPAKAKVHSLSNAILKKVSPETPSIEATDIHIDDTHICIEPRTGEERYSARDEKRLNARAQFTPKETFDGIYSPPMLDYLLEQFEKKQLGQGNEILVVLQTGGFTYDDEWNSRQASK